MKKPLAIYLLLTAAFSLLFQLGIIANGFQSFGGIFVRGMTWSCAAAAVLTCLVTRQSIRTLGWRWPGIRLMAWSYLLPLLYAGCAYGLVWGFGLGHFDRFDRYGRDVISRLPVIATLGMLQSFSYSLGEEIGWRGFLVPTLARRWNFTATALISGAIWALWHYPIIIGGDYNAGTGLYGIVCFTVMVLGISFMFAWFRLKSGSLWTGAVLHSSHNLFIQTFFDRLTRDTVRTRYITGEFGAALAIASLLLGLYFWTRRAEVETQPA